MSDRTNLTIRLRECADNTLRLIDRNVMQEAIGAIKALVAEVSTLNGMRHEDALRDALTASQNEALVAERDDMRALLRDLHAETEALVKERDEALALLREARLRLDIHGDLPRHPLCARIDALLADKEGTT